MTKIDSCRDLNYVIPVAFGQATEFHKLRCGDQKSIPRLNRQVGFIDEIEPAAFSHRLITLTPGELEAAAPTKIEAIFGTDLIAGLAKPERKSVALNCTG